MKKIILSGILIAASFAVQAQQKQLPAKVTIILTAAQIQAIYAKMDTVRLIADESNQPAAWVNRFKQRLDVAFSPIGVQIGQQLVNISADTTKVKPPVKKH